MTHGPVVGERCSTGLPSLKTVGLALRVHYSGAGGAFQWIFNESGRWRSRRALWEDERSVASLIFSILCKCGVLNASVGHRWSWKTFLVSQFQDGETYVCTGCTPSPVQNKVTWCVEPAFKDYNQIKMHGAGLPMLSVSRVGFYTFKFSLVTLRDCFVPLLGR